jgi:small-conductance mechanosensitive channel
MTFEESHPLRNWLAGLMGDSQLALIAATAFVIVLLTILFIVVWRVFSRLGDRLGTRLDAIIRQRIKDLKIQKQRIFEQEDLANLASVTVRAIVTLLKLALALLYLNSVLSYFVWTHELALRIFSLIGETLVSMASALVNYLPELAVVILFIVIARFVIRVLGLIFEGIRRERIRVPGFYPEWARTSFNLVRVAVIALTLVIVFPYLPGSDSPAFKGLSIFFGVLVSLGSTAAIAHLVAGIVITYTRAFRLGDRVRIADTEGDIIERSAFVTRIRTPKNVEVAIPNAMVMNNHIVNYSAQARTGGVMLHTTVTIGYDVPWPLVHDLLTEAARRTNKLESEPEPFVLQTALQDNYVAYELNAYTHVPSGKTRIYSDLHANIQDVFREADVEILSPAYRSMRDGNTRTVPPAMPSGEQEDLSESE